MLFRPQKTKCPRLNIPEGSWGLCSPAWSDVTELERSWSATRIACLIPGTEAFLCAICIISSCICAGAYKRDFILYCSSSLRVVRLPHTTQKQECEANWKLYIFRFVFSLYWPAMNCWLVQLGLAPAPLPIPLSAGEAVIEKEWMDVHLVKSPHKAFQKGRQNIVSIMFMVRQEPGAAPPGNTVWVSRQVMAEKSVTVKQKCSPSLQCQWLLFSIPCENTIRLC